MDADRIIDAALSNAVPREAVDRLQREMLGMPQATGMHTEHTFHGGMYCRRLFRPAGTVIVGRVHKKAHLFVCVSGEIIAWSESGMRRLLPGDLIESHPGTKRVTYAVKDSVGMTVHRTDQTELEALEEELLEPEPNALFDIRNDLKTPEIINEILKGLACPSSQQQS